MQDFRASAVQLRAGEDRDENLARSANLVEQAEAAGARLVCLPEVFSWRGPQVHEVSSAEEIPGPTSDFASALARRLSVYLVAGSLLERSSDPLKCYNTSLLFGPDGALLASYRKIHLFDVAIPGAVTAAESLTRAAGDQPVCVETDIGRIGLAVCYDLRFPELFRRLSECGAEVIVVPSAFTAHTGAAHWHTLVRARAIENQCYVVAPNQYGATQHGFRNYGHSLLVDPWGDIVAEGGEHEDAVLTADFSAARLADVRRVIPCLTHRRLTQ
jgi:deaminated glutathione amidase